ncbi:hypothetical protein WLQ65_22845 [Pseudoalteromonas piscicida]|uniref:chloramphenicol phosphotransferase CPT family protein n=1 Tax=Pseudoalteromonas piscicida TaxID=43662 RepID=UPI0030C9A419
MACIFLNGVSSSGKSSIAREFQALASEPYFHFSMDDFLFNFPAKYRQDALLLAKIDENSSNDILQGFHRSIFALTESNIDIIVDAVFSEEIFYHAACQDNLSKFDAYIVGVHCDPTVLASREQQRADRPIGLSIQQIPTTHNFLDYDLEVDTTRNSASLCAQEIFEYVQQHKPKRRCNTIEI